MENNQQMIQFDEALAIVTAPIHNQTIETISLEDSLNRVLAENVFTDTAIPPFNKSAMDGYACRKNDIHEHLEIIDEIPAGKIPLRKIGKNQCARIFTGAMVPDGADTVLMQEDIEKTGTQTIKFIGEKTHSNICYLGEDVKEGEQVLSKGILLLPQHIAILATIGHTRVKVYKRPVVCIISTGDELIEPSLKPVGSQIRNSNALQLIGQIKQLGLDVLNLGIVKDDKASILQIILQAKQQADVILITGGVSVGDYDFVPQVLIDAGFEIIFHGIKIKPGKPILFGKSNQHWCFGLPGNPVSVFVQFELLIKPFLLNLMNAKCNQRFIKIPAATSFQIKDITRLTLVPINFSEEGTVIPIDYHGSADIHAYTKAEGIMKMPLGKNKIEQGELVDVRPL